MPPKPLPPIEFPIHTFPTASAFTTFLSLNSTTLPGISLHLAKKTSKIPSLSAAEAVEVALCYGWIDGRANTIDENYWSVRYTPRRSKSSWSKKNVESVERLIQQGRMAQEGLKVVEEAKADGRWDRAYVGMGSMSVPEDLEVILGREEVVKRGWDGLGKGERYTLMLRLVSVSEKGRGKCLEGIVEKLRGLGVGGGETVAKKGIVTKKKMPAVKGVKPTGVVKKSAVKKTTVVKKAVLETKTETMASLPQDEIPSRREGLRRRP